MKNISNRRRQFLKNMLAISIFTPACPHILKGVVTPSLKKNKDEIMGTYHISLKDYPELKEVWGSVRIQIPNDITDGFFAPIIVTKLDYEEYGKHYSCIYTLCPHEGESVYDLDIYHEFECSGHGTIFKADGTYVDGPAAEDLQTFEVRWNGGDSLYLDIPAVLVGIEDESEGLLYLRQNYPNPCSNTTSVGYGVELPGQYSLKVYDSIGNQVLTVFSNKFVDSGNYDIDINVSGLQVGAYIISLETADGRKRTKKMAVSR